MKHCVLTLLAALVTAQAWGDDAAYRKVDLYSAAVDTSSRDTEWKPGDGITMEIGGMDWTEDGRLAVVLRKGEVWFIDGVYGNSQADLSFQKFAYGLHEPLGILRDGKDFLVTQRSEVTRLRDTNGDDVADEYLTEASGWNVSGAYHGYAYGPERDGKGDLWVTLNLDMGDRADNDAPWRGWGVVLNKDGGVDPIAAGMRSPSGIGSNLEGDMFFSDQQGTWIPTTPIHHLRKGVFYGNPEGIAPWELPGSPLKLTGEVPKKALYPEAIKQLPQLVPPAVWLPYNKMGRSATDIQLIDQDGKFGPFDGQLLVGEFTNAGVNRVFLEKVDGEYQGACFPFLSGFPSAVFRLTFGKNGSLFVGMTNRGWSSLGSRAYGLQRVDYVAEKPPFEIKEMRAKPDGFELEFTRPVKPDSVMKPGAVKMSSYTYELSSRYGGDEMDTKNLNIASRELSGDGLTLKLSVKGLREVYVHELQTRGIVSTYGDPLVHPDAYYTLNRIPKE